MNPKTNFRNYLYARGFTDGVNGFLSPDCKYGDGDVVRITNTHAEIYRKSNVELVALSDFDTFKKVVG